MSREPSRRPLVAVGLLGLGLATAAGLLVRRTVRRRKEAPAEAAARGLRAGATVLALSVALDSGLEHYRGSFRNRAMFIAPTVATATFAAGALPDRAAARRVFVLALGTGAVGLGFHGYNIVKRIGGIDAANLFYGAPVGAPAALGLAGLFGLLGRRFASGRTELFGRSAVMLAAPITVAALLGTVAEAGFLHFRGAFQNPVMYAPVTVPPLAAVSLGAAAITPTAAPAARGLLQATAVLGLAGPLFHAYGVHRNMGGWGNWSQMLLQGPPIPAPPAFLGIALTGLGLLPSLEQRGR